jgi:hypothetical protein
MQITLLLSPTLDRSISASTHSCLTLECSDQCLEPRLRGAGKGGWGDGAPKLDIKTVFIQRLEYATVSEILQQSRENHFILGNTDASKITTVSFFVVQAKCGSCDNTGTAIRND